MRIVTTSFVTANILYEDYEEQESITTYGNRDMAF